MTWPDSLFRDTNCNPKKQKPQIGAELVEETVPIVVFEQNKTMDLGVTLALSDRSSTCVNCPCSEGSETTTPTKPDISSHRGPILSAYGAAATGFQIRKVVSWNPRKRTYRSSAPSAWMGKKARGSCGDEDTFRIGHGNSTTPSSPRRAFLVLEGKGWQWRPGSSRFRGGGRAGKWRRRGEEVRVGSVFL